MIRNELSTTAALEGNVFALWGAILLVGVSGLWLFAFGVYLALLGGSWYYAIAGVALLGSASLLLRRRPAGIFLYGTVVLVTLAWSIAETGLYGWALVPRMVFLVVIGWLLMSPWVYNACVARRSMRRMTWMHTLSIIVFSAVFGVLLVLLGETPGKLMREGELVTTEIQELMSGGDWSTDQWVGYGLDSRGNRFSSATQITKSNVGHLQKAWEFRAGLYMPGSDHRKGGLQVTPLMVDDTLFICTAFSSVIAIDPVTGEQRWRYDPQMDESVSGHSACRGVSFHRADQGFAVCDARILVGALDNKLRALDANTGQLCPEFGVSGEVDLLQGMGDFPDGWTNPTSPPVIVDDVAVIGAFVRDNQSTHVPPGVIRAYSVYTGDLVWAFDAERPDVTQGFEDDHVFTASSPNAWAPISADADLGLIYVPFGNGSPDFYGANRSANTKRLSSSVAALRASDGAYVWSFQAVHNDLWDYDLAAQPVLADYPVDGELIPALYLATKSGQVFVLDRRTGRPLSEVQEKAVPVSDIPEEESSPTQPYSVGLPDFAGPDLKESDMWGLTPFDQLYCRIRFRQARYEGMYTPPRLGPSIRYPGELGGIDWGGVVVDESRHLLVVNSNHIANYNTLITREEADAAGLVARRNPGAHYPPGAAMEGTPYAVLWEPFLSFLDVPCQRPPYGYLSAVDLETQKLVWRHPIGDSRTSGPFGKALGVALPLGAPNIGGALVTASGVVFIGATQDEMFRAIDIDNGRVLWSDRLPAAGHASPMTYIGADGYQYVVIAAGGQSLRTKPGDHLIAYRLPSL